MAQSGPLFSRESVSIEAPDDDNKDIAREEQEEEGWFRVYRTSGSGGGDAIDVDLAVGGTADEGSDYQSIDRTVTIPANDIDVEFTIDPTDDSEVEGPETVIVKIIPDQDGEEYERGGLYDVVTIEDNDSGGSGGSGGSGSGLDLSVAEVHAGRTAPSNISEGRYQIKADEQFDIGSTFEFQLKVAVGSTTNVRWELWDAGTLWDDLLDSGGGTSFTHTFVGSDDGATPYVRFYDDADGNGDHDGGEAYVKSSEFMVELPYAYNIDVDVSDAIASPPDFHGVQGLLTGAQNLLRKKDSYYDARAAIEFNADDVTTFTADGPGGARPDPVANQTEEYDKHFNASADIVLVDDLVKTKLLGVTNEHDWNQIIVEVGTHSDSLLHVVIAHEIGHGVGLDHDEHDDPKVMNGSLTPGNNELTVGDADAYVN